MVTLFGAQASGHLVPVAVTRTMPTPLQITRSKEARLSALVDQRTADRVDEVAARYGATRAAVVRALVLRGLDQEQGA